MIVVGISNVYAAWVTYLLGDSALVLTFAYVVLVLPYSYRVIDAALSLIDVATLAEAGRSLGAGWFTVIARIVLPNIVPGVLSAAFISVALSSASSPSPRCSTSRRFPVVINLLGKSNASTAVAASLATIVFASRCSWASGSSAGPTYEWREVLVTQTDVDGRPGKDDGASRSVGLHDLTRDFGSFRALDGFDLRMAPVSWSPCSGRRAAARRRCCGSSPAWTTRPPGTSRSAAATSRGYRPTSATWAWSSRPTASSRT